MNIMTQQVKFETVDTVHLTLKPSVIKNKVCLVVICMCIEFQAASNYDSALINIPQQPDSQALIKSLIADFFKEYQWQHSKKFTASTGLIKGSYKDKSSITHMKGHSTSGYLSLSYQFRPNFLFSLTPVKGSSTSKTDASSLRTKSSDKALSTSLDYKALQWLTVNFSFTQKQGKTTTFIDDAPNPTSIAKNIYRIGGISLKFSIPAGSTVFLAPDIGFSCTNITNRAYVDNYNNSNEKKTLALDQLSLNFKACFLLSADVIPYASVGYSKITKYNAHIKSKNSFKGGGGILLFNGVANIDWTVSKANQSITSNSYTLNLSHRF